MINFSEIIPLIIYILLLILCIFIIVHASFQIKKAKLLNKKKADLKERTIKKMTKIIIASTAMFFAIFFNFVTNFSFYIADKSQINNYKEAVSELNDALSLELSGAKNKSFKTQEEIAYFINRQLPIMFVYYLGSNYKKVERFSSEEIFKYKLNDFINHPTLVTYDGMIMSVIKFADECRYVNPKNIAKSDCLIMVDVNHYSEPNQIGQDRTIFAIDTENHTIKADPDFFN